MIRHILIAAAFFAAASAEAKDIITLVAGFPPGGPSTLVARHMADALEKELDVTVVVENKPGASGQLAADHVKRQPADGNTLMVLASTSTLRVVPDGILMPIGRISRFDFIFAVHPSTQVHTLDEYIERVHAGLVAGDYTTPGAGSVPHLALEQLAYEVARKRGYASRLPLLHIPYQGTAQAVQGIIGGHVPAGMFGLTEMRSALAMGLKPIFIGSATRSSIEELKNVPTLIELGYDIDTSGWHALYVHKDVDASLKAKLHAAVERAARTIPQSLKDLGFIGDASSPEKMWMIHNRDFERWMAVAHRIGVQP
ncbi:MAG: putative exported protein [Candidatus Kaiserbacteria bacterium]|nr:putative exported protein [Candidatus Kaiserbacteria bacterium]